jgi:hypothetical protein
MMGKKPNGSVKTSHILITWEGAERANPEIKRTKEEAEKKAFANGEESGKADLANAVGDAETEMYASCVAAIEAKGAKIGLTDEQIYKVVNHILWDCRP